MIWLWRVIHQVIEAAMLNVMKSNVSFLTFKKKRTKVYIRTLVRVVIRSEGLKIKVK